MQSEKPHSLLDDIQFFSQKIAHFHLSAICSNTIINQQQYRKSYDVFFIIETQQHLVHHLSGSISEIKVMVVVATPVMSM